MDNLFEKILNEPEIRRKIVKDILKYLDENKDIQREFTKAFIHALINALRFGNVKFTITMDFDDLINFLTKLLEQSKGVRQ